MAIFKPTLKERWRWWRWSLTRTYTVGDPLLGKGELRRQNRRLILERHAAKEPSPRKRNNKWVYDD